MRDSLVDAAACGGRVGGAGTRAFAWSFKAKETPVKREHPENPQTLLKADARRVSGMLLCYGAYALGFVLLPRLFAPLPEHGIGRLLVAMPVCLSAVALAGGCLRRSDANSNRDAARWILFAALTLLVAA